MVQELRDELRACSVAVAAVAIHGQQDTVYVRFISSHACKIVQQIMRIIMQCRLRMIRNSIINLNYYNHGHIHLRFHY